MEALARYELLYSTGVSLTLGICTDQGGKVGNQRDGGEIRDIRNFQGAKKGAQPLRTEPAKTMTKGS